MSFVEAVNRSRQSHPLKIGDWVIATAPVLEYFAGREIKHADKGNIGHVVDICPGCYPTIFWEKSGTVCDGIPGEEMQRLCGADFAARPATTPGGGVR